MNEPVHGGSICACVVQMKKAEGGSKGIQRWLKRQQRRLSGKMLGIGDGANDVAMIQAADVGIGIMGKEGRQVTLTSSSRSVFCCEKSKMQFLGGLLHQICWCFCCSDTCMSLAQDKLE